MEDITEEKKGFKKHIPFIVLIIALALIINYAFLSPTATFHRGDWRISHQNTIVIMDQALEEGKLPFWTTLADSGMPFYAMPDKPFLYPPLLLMLLFFDAVFSMNLMVVLHAALAGLFMYFLMVTILKNEFGAFFSALIFMLSHTVMFGPPFWRYTITFTPLLFLLLIYAFKFDKNKTAYSVAAGIVLALMFLGGGIFPFYYTCLFIIALYFIYSLIITKNKISTAKNLFLIGIIMSVIFLGITLVKILPTYEWSNSINRAEGLSVQESKGTPLSMKSAFEILVAGKPAETPYQIGILGMIFVFLSFPYLKKGNKHAIFFWTLMILVLLFAFGAFYETLWKLIPGLSSQRGVTRALFVFTFAASALAGFGAKSVFEKITELKLKNIFFGIIALLILANFFFFSYFKVEYLQLEPFSEQLDNNELVKYLSTQEKPFRMTSYEVRGIDWNDMEVATIPLKIEETSHAFGGIWFTDYLHGFITLAYYDNLSYSKIFGMLNVKYVMASEELGIQGLSLIKKFPEYKRAWPDFYDGPYLYSNENAVPRAFYTENTILVAGNDEQAKNAVRYILVNSNFNPKTLAVIRGGKEMLNNANLFDGIVLVEGSVEGNVPYQLKTYSGTVFPDIAKGETEISTQKLEAFLSSFNQTITPETKLEYRQNSLTIKEPMEGWLILSERYSMFPDWKAYADGKEISIYQADGVLTAVNVPQGTKELYFSYTPKYFTFGAYLALITLACCAVYLFLFFKKANKREEPVVAQ